MSNLQTPDILKSKRFWTLAITLALFVLNDVTNLSLSEAQMQDIVNIALLVILGYSAQDVASAIKTGVTKYDKPKPPLGVIESVQKGG